MKEKTSNFPHVKASDICHWKFQPLSGSYFNSLKDVGKICAVAYLLNWPTNCVITWSKHGL